jgi:hypothetical protein
VTVSAAAQYNDVASKRAGNLVQFQLFAMYFEAHCGLVVIKDQVCLPKEKLFFLNVHRFNPDKLRSNRTENQIVALFGVRVWTLWLAQLYRHDHRTGDMQRLRSAAAEMDGCEARKQAREISSEGSSSSSSSSGDGRAAGVGTAAGRGRPR